MMLRIVQIFGIFICVSTGAVLVLCLYCWEHNNPDVEKICAQPDIAERFRETHSQREIIVEKSSPLVTQAQAFAAYLSGPSPDKEGIGAKSIPSPSSLYVPKITTMAQPVSSAKFKLQGTSYYPHEPAKSMALISEPGSPEGNERWIKEGARLGHLVIDKIKHGAVVYRDAGGQLHEMPVEHSPVAPNLVRNHIPSLGVIAQAESDRTSAAGHEMDSNSVDR